MPTFLSLQELHEKQDMKDSELVRKKTVERKKHPKIVGILKELVIARMITKRILNLEVNLTVGKLLVFGPVIEKQLIKAIIKDQAV